jgi:anaerobic selenocysteine-containing dehydrogenase
LSYDQRRGGSGVQWPVNHDHPDGAARLYTDAVFATDTEFCQSYGHDLVTGATNEADEYRAHDPAGRAVLKAAAFTEPHEPPDEDYPLIYTTGRTAFHFHTRTKTRRAGQLNAAAPTMWLEVSAADAEHHGIGEGDRIRVESRRGRVEARARISGVRQGIIFAPFHFGYFDSDDDTPTAANELTITDWDPVSKQPIFKVCAVQLSRLGISDDQAVVAPENTASSPVTASGAQ